MRYRCYRCPCKAHPGRFHEFEADKPACPKCGAGEPAVLELTDVHFLLPDGRGPLVGLHGLRWKVACMPRREHLATELEHFAATDHPAAVTCPSCQGVPEWQALAALLPAQQRAGLVIDDSGCCG